MKQPEQLTAGQESSPFGPEYPHWPDATRVAFLERRLVVLKEQMAHRETIADNQRHQLKALHQERETALARLREKHQELELLNRELAAGRDHLEQEVLARTRELEEKNAQLADHATHLEQINISLDALVRQSVHDRDSLAMTILAKQRTTIGPVLERLLNLSSNIEQQALLQEALALLMDMPTTPDTPDTPMSPNNCLPTCLTRRELEVAQLLALGKTCREIGQALNISERTVQSCCYSIRGKCGLDRKVNLKAYLAGLIPAAGE